MAGEWRPPMAGERQVAVARAQLRLALAGAQWEARMPRALLLPAGRSGRSGQGRRP